jgi:hypothetical protein
MTIFRRKYMLVYIYIYTIIYNIIYHDGGQYGNEFAGSVKMDIFLQWLDHYEILKKGYIP